MKRSARYIPVFILLLVCVVKAAAQSRPLAGGVVAFSDGDTITVLDANNKQYRIRLKGGRVVDPRPLSLIS